MHAYSFISGGDASVTRARAYGIMGIAAALSTMLLRHGYEVAVVGSAPGAWNVQLTFLIGAITPLAVFAAIVRLFDARGWKQRHIRGIMAALGCKLPPNIGGSYHGTLSFTHGSSRLESDIRVTIAQTWSRFLIQLEVYRPQLGSGGRSYSSMAELSGPLPDGTIEFRYLYGYKQFRPAPKSVAQRQVTILGAAEGAVSAGAGRAITIEYFSNEGGSGTIALQQAD